MKDIRDIFGQLHTQEYKATKKLIVSTAWKVSKYGLFLWCLETFHAAQASTKWKEVKRRPEKINELILKTKADLKDGLDSI